MSWREDYSSAAGIRNAVIDAIIPEVDQDEINLVMRGMELGIISSEKKMVVSTAGTKTIEFYIRYLEQKVFNLMDLQAHYEQNESKQVECAMCKGDRYVARQVKKKREQIICPKCLGVGKTWELIK